MTEEIFPFLLGAMAFLIPIIALVLRHQRHMTELTMRAGDRTQQRDTQIEAMRTEIQELKNMLNEHVLNLDDRLASVHRRLDEVEKRSVRG